MKRTVRMILLMVGMLFAYQALVVPATAEDGAPVPVCTGQGCR